MVQNQNIDSTSSPLRRILGFLFTIIVIFQIIKKYELICKKGDHHETRQEDLDEFLNDDTEPKNTECVDCGCALQLISDEEDSETFWIKEI